MVFRTQFTCLWCGAAWSTRGPDDLEGWAQLCPDCVGRAGSNPFLRGRVRAGLAARAASGPTAAAQAAGGVPGPAPATLREGSAAPVVGAFPDDWFLRRGRFSHGAIHDTAWAAELDVVTRWLDDQPLAGRVVELAAGTGFFTPLLAGKGELFAFEADAAALGLARDRLLAHRLRAHLHAADPWADFPPAADPTPADALVAAFLLGRVRGAGMDAAAAGLRARLRTGGRLALVELRPDPAGGPPPGVAWTFHEPVVLEAALLRAGLGGVTTSSSGRFFQLVAATAA